MKVTMRSQIMTSVICLLITATSYAAVTTIQPNEASSGDVFTYAFPEVNAGFGAPGPTTPDDLNWDDPNDFPVNNIITIADTTSRNTGDATLQHDSHTLIKFDLSSSGISSGDVTSARIGLWAADGNTATGGVFANPTVVNALVVNVNAITQAWDETTVTWNTTPTVNGTAASQTIIDGISQWFWFDVSTLIGDWLDTPANNNGVALSLTGPFTVAGAENFAPFDNADPFDGELFVASAFVSSSGTEAFRPKIEITTVPEPSTYALIFGAVAIGLKFSLCRRK